MDVEAFNNHLARVGLLAIADSDSMLEDVGQSAWHRSGGLTVEQALPSSQFQLLRMLTLPGGMRAETASILRDWCDAPNSEFRCHVIITIGGEGFAARDVVPEATHDVIEREAPGFSEMLRQIATEERPAGEQSAVRSAAALSRGITGIRKKTLIVNLPACFTAPERGLAALLKLLPAALDALYPDGD